jgi:replicative DNA helicase
MADAHDPFDDPELAGLATSRPAAPERQAPKVGASRVPPSNLQAEESLLGAMLLSRDAVAAAAEVVSAGDFYKPAHGHLYDAVTSLVSQGEPVDPVTVADELRRADLLDVVGGPEALIRLQTGTPATTNAHHYAKIVEEHALLRRMIGVASEIAELGYSLPEDVTKTIDQAESMVYELSQHRMTDSMSQLQDMLKETLDRIEELYDRGDAITGVPSGYSDLDAMLSGLQPNALVVVGARPAVGKALSLDTPIPTPEGWTTMGELEVGDVVFDERGQPCNVTYVSPIHRDRNCFNVRFDDGARVVADAEHQWFMHDLPAWKSLRDRHYRSHGGYSDRADPNADLARDQSARIREPRIVTTQQMLDEGVFVGADRRANWYLPLADALDLPDVELPVDPYVLGCWLGDGKTPGSEITCGTADAPHFASEFRAAGYPFEWRRELQYATTPVAGSGAWQHDNGPSRVLTRELQAVGPLRGATKHVPRIYLRASAKQRLSLLQGLMDTDGTVGAHGVAELCLANRDLLLQARELVCSLGHKPGQIRAKVIPLGDGRVAQAWRFTWTPLDPVFRLPRKAERQQTTGTHRSHGKMTRRHVVAIEPVPTVPVRCITVDSPSHLYLAGESMVPTHNTAFALGMASHAALHARRPVLFFSLEMSRVELSQRLLCSEARVDSQKVRNGRLDDSDWTKITHAVGRLGEAPIWIDDNPNVSLMEIRGKARRLKSRVGDLGMVVVDYIQLMTGRAGAESRQVEVAELSRGLKILARELEVPVVALAQLNRSLEQRADKRPMLSDLRESGSLEQDADVVMFLYRDEVYNPESPDRGTAEVLVAKHRSGPTGMCRLAYLSHYTRFANMAQGV